MDTIQDTYISAMTDLWHEILKLSNFTNYDQPFEKLKGLSLVEIRLITLISLNPDMIFRDICKWLNIPKSSLTNMIDRLEEGNYMSRVISKRDRRSFSLTLSDEGILAMEEYRRLEYLVSQEIMGAFTSTEDKSMLLTVINKILSYLHNKAV